MCGKEDSNVNMTQTCFGWRHSNLANAGLDAERERRQDNVGEGRKQKSKEGFEINIYIHIHIHIGSCENRNEGTG